MYIKALVVGLGTLVVLANGGAIKPSSFTLDSAKANAGLLDLWTDNSGVFDYFRTTRGTAVQVKEALHWRANVDAKANDGNTAPIEAVKADNADCVKALGDVNARNPYGETPLTVAEHCPDIVAILKAAGAKESAPRSGALGSSYTLTFGGR